MFGGNLDLICKSVEVYMYTQTLFIYTRFMCGNMLLVYVLINVIG